MTTIKRPTFVEPPSMTGRFYLSPTKLCGFALLLGFNVASAEEMVLSGRQVTEAALIDALAPEASADVASGVRTRGLRPALRSKTGASGRASLLVTFKVNVAELTPEAKSVLDKLAGAMQSDRLTSLAFRVEGHADPRGTDDRNQLLSQQRATAVAEYLSARHGISADRLLAVGKGSSDPLDPENPDDPRNRRVTIVTLKK